jgi:hypothetical protein
MSMISRLFQIAGRCSQSVLRSPGRAARDFANFSQRERGAKAANRCAAAPPPQSPPSADPPADANPLRAYFDGISEGPGVWKWLHYFEIYHRHLAKFVGREITLVEVGVYSGGSMPMWRHYFGPRCRIHGIDIQPQCKAYENDFTTIHIGDQADRNFWRRFRQQVPSVDILIDDGGHLPDQQMVTLEEMLPHLNSGGVYVCEDVNGIHNPFASYVQSLAGNLNAMNSYAPGALAKAKPTPFQTAIHSVHLYPYVAVIEKTDGIFDAFEAPKHGTQWQPFL